MAEWGGAARALAPGVRTTQRGGVGRLTRALAPGVRTTQRGGVGGAARALAPGVRTTQRGGVGGAALALAPGLRTTQRGGLGYLLCGPFFECAHDVMLAALTSKVQGRLAGLRRHGTTVSFCSHGG